MKIYAAGWALQSPALNIFKCFLRLNPAVEISGIIYPKKIPNDVEGIPVLDFDAARERIAPSDIVLNCHRPAVPNEGLSAEFKNFFDELGVKTTNVNVFVSSMIGLDLHGQLRLPIEGATSKDVRHLQAMKPLFLADGMFADLESSTTAQMLDAIVRESKWDEILAFDRDKTPESVLFETISDLYRRGYAKNFYVLDTPHVFLNVLLKIKALRPEERFLVKLEPSAAKQLGSRLEFFQHALEVVEVLEAGKHSDAFLLAGSVAPIVEAFQNAGKAAPAIFFMRRSIFDYRAVTPMLDRQKHRVLLRQVDTSLSNLIAAVIE
jgi:hypothetical protein